MLNVTVPTSWQPERAWIANVVFEQFLGLDHRIIYGEPGLVRISAEDKSLTLSDEFFESGMSIECLPSNWDVSQDMLGVRLCAPTVPVLFGVPGFTTCRTGAQLGLDVFGSAFFMLARYEETRRFERDQHGRFPADQSAAVRAGFLERPIIDEYVEILWAAMKNLWPRLTRKERSPQKLISCDVDHPFDPACASIFRLGKRMLGHVFRDRSFQAALSSLKNFRAVQAGDRARDPYWQALCWIMDVNEHAGNQVTFNFIPETTHARKDNSPPLEDSRMRELLRAVYSRGHLIGIHPGYNTYRHPDAFARSVATLRRILDEEGIEQDELGGRQHYLRWDVNRTAQLWETNSLSYDSTLGYPTVAGFRTGTCHEYTMFDVVGRNPLALKQRPLVVMENAVIDQCNMGLGHDEDAWNIMRHYRQFCEIMDGDFTLLWHNSSFLDEAACAMYCDIID